MTHAIRRDALCEANRPMATAFIGTTPSLSVDGLCYAWQHQICLGPLHFQVNSGETLVICGANGVGKTTLLRILAGFLQPISGIIRYSGQSLNQACQRREHVAFVGHLLGLQPDLRVIEHLHLGVALHGCQPGRDPMRALAQVDLHPLAQTPVRCLSAGQAQRLALARLWLTPRPIWLIDEPCAHLDEPGRQLTAQLLIDHQNQGGCAIITSHDSSGLCQHQTLILSEQSI